jgi:large subunit ribosomal protein L25
MQEISIELEKREITGKAVKRLRRDGQVPAVIHDHGKDSVVVMGPFLQMSKMYQQAGKNHPVKINADGKNYTALIKNATFDPKKNQLSHVVFNAVKANEKVDAEVPVRIRFAEGNEASPAERAGLVVLHQMEAVEVETTPNRIPDALYFDGEKLIAAGDHVTVADLEVPEGVTVKDDPAQPVATVFEPSALQAANDAAGGTAEEEAPAAAESGEETATASPEAGKPAA